jgi:hypothetical protein
LPQRGVRLLSIVGILAAGCDQDPAEGGVSQEVADLLAGLTGVERRIALLWRSHVITEHFL